MIFKSLYIFKLLFIVSLSLEVTAQISWERSGETSNLPLQLFHSTHSIILPTTETLQKGDLEFEVLHRFIPTINDGSKELFGFDGPANIKLGLSYGVTNDLVAAVSRSNVNDNLEFIVKYRVFGYDNDLLPFVIGVRGAAVWNTDPRIGRVGDNRNFQYYTELILNTLINKKLGIGIVPAFLYNSDIYSKDRETSFTLGSIIQYYFSSSFSVLAEWNPTISGYRNLYDSFSFGFELEIGGHFFKIIATNNSALNTSQYLGGSDLAIQGKNLRIGFNITRLLKF